MILLAALGIPFGILRTRRFDLSRFVGARWRHEDEAKHDAHITHDGTLTIFKPSRLYSDYRIVIFAK